MEISLLTTAALSSVLLRRHGNYLTQDECREIVAYAAARHVTVVPEIEMPGHATAAIASYPGLGQPHDPPVSVATQWGVHSTVWGRGVMEVGRGGGDTSYLWLQVSGGRHCVCGSTP